MNTGSQAPAPNNPPVKVTYDYPTAFNPIYYPNNPNGNNGIYYTNNLNYR